MSLLARRGASEKRKRDASPARAAAPTATPSAPAAATAADLWVEKHAPRSSADLAMHKKKVEELRQWLATADASLQLGLPPSPRMLVLTERSRRSRICFATVQPPRPSA